jgi:predicted amidohydrolase YtcJ
MGFRTVSALALGACALAAALVVGCGGSGTTPADTVFRNGYVVTMDGDSPPRQGVAVREGRIVATGSDAEMLAYVGANTRIVDLGGRMLMPGFVDAHLHALAAGRALLQCDLAYAPLSHAQLQAALQACLDSSADKEPDAWLEAVNWDRQTTASLSGDPTKAVLDALNTKRPIAVTSSDFHTVLANSRALALAGISAATSDPAGGKFLRAADGSPTGICEDGASFVLKGAIPPDSDEDLMKQGRAALAAMRAQGVTSFMDAAAGEVQGKVFKALQKSGELTARTSLALQVSVDEAAASPTKAAAAAKALAAGIDQGGLQVTPGVNARVVKLFLDGVVNAPADTGALLTPYLANAGSDEAPRWVPGSTLGSLYFAPDVLNPLLLALADAGLDVHMHATGERAVREALDAVQGVRSGRAGADFRPAIAHDETVAVADYPRFAALDTMATMSFQWAQRAPYSIGETEQHLGPDRFARMEPFGSLRRAGARVVYGSDWPIDAYDIFLALKAGVTRAGDPTNPHSPASLAPVFEGPINADPALSRLDTLRAITLNSAYQLRQEQQLGSIQPGKLADLIVLERNFMTVPDEELARNRVPMTMVGGKVVMATGDMAGLLSASQRALNDKARVLSMRASAGRSGPTHAGTSGDGHRH